MWLDRAHNKQEPRMIKLAVRLVTPPTFLMALIAGRPVIPAFAANLNGAAEQRSAVIM